ncbi:MAG: amidohydrolase family protein [Planctomycetota bacterium]
MPGREMTAAIAALALAGAAQAQPTERFVLSGSSILAADGSIQQGRALLIGSDGRIRRVAEQSELDSLRIERVEFEGAVITPGLFDLASFAGLEGDNAEVAYASDLEARAIDGLDPTSASLTDLLEGGVTGAMIIPAPVNPISGLSATINTSTGNAWVDQGAVIFSVAPIALDTLFGPTSRTGALELIRRSLGEAEDGMLAEVARGDRPAVIYAESSDGALAGYSALLTYGAEPVIALSNASIDVALELEEELDEVRFIAGPFAPNAAPESLAGPGLMARGGAEVAFRGGSAEGLRLSAAMAVQYGMNPQAARRGITSVAAGIAGVGDVTGSIEPGMRADLVVWSGDPLAMSSQVLAVYVGGQLVYAAPNSTESME